MTVQKENRHLYEQATLIGESANSDGTWKVRLISEGKGSSGTYTRDLLENHHAALDDLLSFKNHPGVWDGPETRDFTMLVGEIVGKTWVENDETGRAAVFGNYLPDPEYKDKLERYRKKLGVSIYIEGSGYLDEQGEFIVDWFNPNDPYASLDVVIAAGARGRFEESMKTMYARRSAEHQTPAASAAEDEPKGYTVAEIQDVLTAIEKQNELLTSLVGSKQEEAQTEADAAAVESAVTEKTEAIKAAVESVESAKAELLPLQHKSLLERAWKGEDVTAAIESDKAIAKEAKEAAGKTGAGEIDPETGRLGEAASTDDYKLKGFKG